MIHDVFNFIADLVMHVDFLRHNGSLCLKLRWLNGNGNYAFARPVRPELQPVQDGMTTLSCWH